MSSFKTYSLLCLGDSYTIGESVEESGRFPEQTITLLKEQGILFEKPLIIAQTGWTTDELEEAIRQQKISKTFDFVTLLIGVNNQYRARELDNYRKEFSALLQKAIQFAGGYGKHVIVLSIPDWGVTPFVSQDAQKRTPGQIARELDSFNAINKEEAEKAQVNYLDITAISRKAAQDPELLAADGLHPSSVMYFEWAKLLADKLEKLIRS